MFYQKPYDYMIMIMMYNNNDILFWNMPLVWPKVSACDLSGHKYWWFVYTDRYIFQPPHTHQLGLFAKYSL